MSKEEEMKEIIRKVRGDIIRDEARRDDVQPTYLVTNDEEITKTVNADEDLSNMKPLYSRLMRLTKISTKEKEVFQTSVDLLVGSMIIDMDEEEFDMGHGAKLKAHAMFLKTMINDSHKGFKMKLLSRSRGEIILTPEVK